VNIIGRFLCNYFQPILLHDIFKYRDKTPWVLTFNSLIYQWIIVLFVLILFKLKIFLKNKNKIHAKHPLTNQQLYIFLLSWVKLTNQLLLQRIYSKHVSISDNYGHNLWHGRLSWLVIFFWKNRLEFILIN
jgi:hypothetical protein